LNLEEIGSKRGCGCETASRPVRAGKPALPVNHFL